MRVAVVVLVYRNAKLILSELEPRLRGIRKWYHKMKHLPRAEPRNRRAIAVDETKIKVKASGIYGRQ